MWTSMYVPSRINSFTPDHFVPIVKKPQRSLNAPICVIDSLKKNDLSNESVRSEMSSLDTDTGITVTNMNVTDTDMNVDITDTDVKVDVTDTDVKADVTANVKADVAWHGHDCWCYKWWWWWWWRRWETKYGCTSPYTFWQLLWPHPWREKKKMFTL